MHDISKQEAEDIKNGAAVLLDVRSSMELAEASSPYATHFDMQQIASGQLPDIDKSKKVFIFCRSGGRAGQAKNILNANGYDAVNVGGLVDLPEDLRS